MDNPEDFLVTRRSRRSTAGNRMEAALAEIALDDLGNDAEDDVDFINGKDEEDVFESDFESTDEEEEKEDAEGGDKAVEEEEKQARKAARSRVEKATAAAHARQKVTFNPQAESETQPERKITAKRRASLGGAVNAKTGETGTGTKRQSRRRHTILNTSETANRMKRSEEKRAAAVPKRTKTETRILSQGELIALALDNEEGNIVDHRDYLKVEEEKRKRARVVRATVNGPLLRWISKAEEITVNVVDPNTSTSQAIPSVPSPGFSYAYGAPPYGQPPYPYNPNVPYYQPTQPYPAPYQYPPSTSSQSAPSTAPPPVASNIAYPYTLYPQPPSIPPSIPPPPIARTEKVAKNYVIHELGQSDDVSKPAWNENMEAMFGDHVKWEDLKVYVGKGRPLSRPKQMCPITGKIAHYLDPRTGVPYADLGAFRTLTKILNHEYVWNEGLGCYVHEEDPGSKIVEPSMGGVPEDEANVYS